MAQMCSTKQGASDLWVHSRQQHTEVSSNFLWTGMLPQYRNPCQKQYANEMEFRKILNINTQL